MPSTMIVLTVLPDTLISPSSSVENLAWLKSERVAKQICAKLHSIPAANKNKAIHRLKYPVANSKSAEIACENAVTTIHRKTLEKNTDL